MTEREELTEGEWEEALQDWRDYRADEDAEQHGVALRAHDRGQRARIEAALSILARCERLYAELQHSHMRDGTTSEAYSDIRRDWNALLKEMGTPLLPCIADPRPALLPGAPTDG
jgi:hypothetical protein